MSISRRLLADAYEIIKYSVDRSLELYCALLQAPIVSQKCVEVFRPRAEPTANSIPLISSIRIM